MKLRRTLAILGISSAMVGGTALAASAITGGELDGNGHPNVGMIAFYDSTGRFRCSATLVSSCSATAVRADPLAMWAYRRRVG